LFCLMYKRFQQLIVFLISGHSYASAWLCLVSF
jgi:hypothetical protein